MNDQNTTKSTECCGTSCEVPEAKNTVRPGYRVNETDSGITLEIALPGVRKEDVSVSSTESILTLTASRADSVPDDWKVHQATDRPDGYELRIRLNRTLDPGRIDATLEHGVLHLAVAKREEAQPRRISVN